MPRLYIKFHEAKNYIKSRISTSQNIMPLHKMYKKQKKLRQDSHSSYKKLPTENGEQITQYGEHMKQWGNNTFPTRKFI